MTATISTGAFVSILLVGILIGAAGMGALVVGRRIGEKILEGNND